MAGRKKTEDATLSSSDLELQMEAFLKKGGKVVRVPRGESGVVLNKGSTYLSSRATKK